VTQLRREERPEAVTCRELEHERELHSQMQMSQSCEDLAILPSLVNNNGSKVSAFFYITQISVCNVELGTSGCCNGTL
jgi:hypothetical protein